MSEKTHRAYERLGRQVDRTAEHLNNEQNYVPQTVFDQADIAVKGLSAIVENHPDDARDYLLTYHTGLIQFRHEVDNFHDKLTGDDTPPFPEESYASAAALMTAITELDRCLVDDGQTTTAPLTGAMPNMELVDAAGLKTELEDLIAKAEALKSDVVELDDAVAKDKSLSDKGKDKIATKSSKVKLSLNLLIFSAAWEREVDLVGIGRSARLAANLAIDLAKAIPQRVGSGVAKAGASIAGGVSTVLKSATKLIGKGKEVDNRPSDETREQWELEAAVSILLGEIIPEARRRHLQEIKLTGYSNSLFEALQAREANLTDLYVDPEADRWPRQIKAKDLSPLSGLSGLQTLDLDGTQVSDLSPLRGLSELRALYLRDTQVSDLAPLRGLSGLQTLDLDGTQVSDLSPLRGLSEFIFLFLDRTQVIDWSPVDHVDDVIGRPHDWPRKSKV